MKKILSLLIVIAAVFSSCEDKNTYTVDGNFNSTDYDGKLVYLQKATDLPPNGEIAILDSATVKDGKFSFKALAGDKPEIRFISLGKMSEMSAPDPERPTVATFIAEPGKIEITIDKTALTVKGTPLNDKFNKVHEYSNQMVTLYKEANEKGRTPELEEKLKAMYTQMQAENVNFAKENMQSPAGQFIFITSIRSLERDQVKELIALSDTSFQNRTEIKEIIDMIASQEAAEAAVLNKPVQDGKLQDQKGKPVSLSAYTGKGKVVLLDFWASWCAPCKKEFPNLKNLYAQYKDKGLEIVAVSIDEDRNEWQKAIQENQLPWIQLVDDAEGTVATAFGVQSIPYTLLLDKNGNVIAINPRGDELTQKIADALK